MLLALILIGQMAELGGWYFAAVAVVAILMAYHQWLARERKPEGCFRAFLHNHYIGMAVFIGILLDYTFRPVVAG
jgi:4-hydroxybenzoate polyprenyltransferase